ncbi:hypothetical protein ACVRYP_04805 [Streptococcus rifensis]
MSKVKWILSLFGLALISLVFAGVWYCSVHGIVFYHPTKEVKNEKFKEYSLDYTGIGDIGVIYDMDFGATAALDVTKLGQGGLLEMEAGMLVSSQFIKVSRFGRVKDFNSNEHSKHPIDYFYVDLYESQAETKTYMKTLDLVNIVQSYNKNYLPRLSKNTFRHKETGRWVFEVTVLDTRQEESSDMKDKELAVDIETEKVIGLFKLDDYDTQGTYSLSPVFNEVVTNVYDKLKSRGFSYYNQIETDDGKKDDISELYLKDGINYSELNLAKEYPESVRLMKKGNVFELVHPAQDKEIARLLAKAGEEDVFEGVTLYGAYSKDGKDHVVQSYEEAMSWYQAPEESKE